MRESETESEREREREIETDRQRERHRERKRERAERERERGRERESERARKQERKRDTQTDGVCERDGGREGGRENERERERASETDRQTDRTRESGESERESERGRIGPKGQAERRVRFHFPASSRCILPAHSRHRILRSTLKVLLLPQLLARLLPMRSHQLPLEAQAKMAVKLRRLHPAHRLLHLMHMSVPLPQLLKAGRGGWRPAQGAAALQARLPPLCYRFPLTLPRFQARPLTSPPVRQGWS